MKPFIISCFLILSISLQAQLDKNTWLVGGNANLYTYTSEFNSQSLSTTSKYTSIDLTSSIGYFVKDKFVCGLRPYFSKYKGESSGGGRTNGFKLAVGPFMRYYFLNKEKPFNILTDISYSFGTNQYRTGNYENGRFNTLYLTSGVEFYFNSSVGLEFLIGYKFQDASINNSPAAYTNSFKGFQSSIGFSFHLEK